MHTHATSYSNRLNALFFDPQSVGEYVAGYRIRVRKDVYSLSIDEATIGEERSDRSPSPKRGDDDIIKVVVPPQILRC